jgi:formate dehydrogenase subunit gamma
MTFAFSLQRILLLVLLLILLSPVIGSAAVPHESAVPAYAEEQTILQREKSLPEPGFWSLKSGINHFDRHFIVPLGIMPEQDVILQRGGNTWRTLRNGPFAAVAGALLLVVPLVIFGFYHAVGPGPRPKNESGRKIQRFSAWDRVVHWATAITFIILAITGIIIMFGKNIMLPWMGHDIFSWVAIISKYAHNFVGPAFILCSVVMFFTFLKENFFRRWDWNWIKKGGGLISHKHVPAGYFNAGEKVWFWGGVVLLGLLMSITGLLLNFPYFYNVGVNIGLTRYVLQMADYVHIIGATLYIIGAMGHIYIGTSGTPGAYEAMRHGTVDEEWAKAHHELWYNDVKSGGYTARGTPANPPPRGATTYPRT